MPTYEYLCKNCNNLFSLVMSISEHGKRKVQCPRCGSNAVEQQLQPFFARTSKKS